MPGAFGSAFEADIEQYADALTASVGQVAKDLGWPAHVADDITLVHRRDGMKIERLFGPQEEMDDLEYGTEDRKAMPAIHTVFNTTQGDKIMAPHLDRLEDGFVSALDAMFE